MTSSEPFCPTVRRLQESIQYSRNGCLATACYANAVDLHNLPLKRVYGRRQLESQRKVGVPPFLSFSRGSSRQLECGKFGRTQPCWTCSPSWIPYPTRLQMGSSLSKHLCDLSPCLSHSVFPLRFRVSISIETHEYCLKAWCYPVVNGVFVPWLSPTKSLQKLLNIKTTLHRMLLLGKLIPIWKDNYY